MSKAFLLSLRGAISLSGTISSIQGSGPMAVGIRRLVAGCQHFPRKFHLGQVTATTNDKLSPEVVREMTNEDWAKRLAPDQYFVTRERGTEAPFSGKYYKHKGEGVYTCVCCATELFSSKSKYDSGSGWPSFYEALQSAETDGTAEGVLRRKDVSHGMVRTEIICKNCNAHLGHVFDDGPKPTGERFCINSCALKFQPKKLSE